MISSSIYYQAQPPAYVLLIWYMMDTIDFSDRLADAG